MADQPNDRTIFPVVRRFEAAGFRAWPATSVHYDGAWAIRLTASNPAKRLNSINPLDPGDTRDIDERIARARSRFDAYDRPLIVRMSPLAGSDLSQHFDTQGWSRFGESQVMSVALAGLDLDDVMDVLPMRDVARFSGAHLKVRHLPNAMRPGIAEVVDSIEPPTGFFVFEKDEAPVATAICVHDGDLAGLFELATDPEHRGQGHGRRTILSALKWARLHGARTGWLQVEASNEGAVQLYESLGFRTIYTYHYRSPQDDRS